MGSTDGVFRPSSGTAHGEQGVEFAAAPVMGGRDGVSGESNEAMRTLNALCHDADGKTVVGMRMCEGVRARASLFVLLTITSSTTRKLLVVVL
jgi:hypothetical protein